MQSAVKFYMKDESQITLRDPDGDALTLDHDKDGWISVYFENQETGEKFHVGAVRESECVAYKWVD